MSKAFKTDQEEFWNGKFGDDYIKRNDSEKVIESNRSMFSEIISPNYSIKSILEIGPNIGMNLIAINSIFPDIALSGIEINPKATERLKELNFVEVFEGSVCDESVDLSSKKWDLVLTKGVLIHINPKELNYIYERIYQLSNRYILIAEYYNPIPMTLSYRGHAEKLFKRDFAGEMITKFNLKLVDYGFIYHKDNHFPQDDLTWFLLEK